MNTIGVTVLDHTVQQTNAWLKGIEGELVLENRQEAYRALRLRSGPWGAAKHD